MDRCSVVEDFCQIESFDEPKKQNKFDILEDLILKYKSELKMEISDFNSQIKSTRYLVDNLEKEIVCQSKKIQLAVSIIFQYSHYILCRNKTL